jgi:hypothetical protein
MLVFSFDCTISTLVVFWIFTLLPHTCWDCYFLFDVRCEPECMSDTLFTAFTAFARPSVFVS